MDSKILDFMKCKNYVISEYILKNYKKLDLSIDSFVLFVYFINKGSYFVCDYNLFKNELNMDVKDVMNFINDLCMKKLIQIDLKKNEAGKIEEYVNLDLFYNKVFLDLVSVDDVKESNLFSIFEKELGRSLSPIEYELINGWIDCNYKEEIILAALREAVINGVNNFRYIDRILFEWNKKGIDSSDKVNKNKKDFRKENNVVIPDIDWLNDDE